MYKNQKGVGALETLLAIVLIGLIGVIGWYIYRANQDTLNSGYNSNITVQQTDIPEVNSIQDLSRSEKFLLSQDLDVQLNTVEIDAALEL